MKARARVIAVFTVLVVIGLFAFFVGLNHQTELSTTERRFVGTWEIQSRNERVQFSSDRSFIDGEFNGTWEITDGNIVLATWRSEPQTFRYDFLNSISRPFANTWASMNADEDSYQLEWVDDETVRIRSGGGEWVLLKR